MPTPPQSQSSKNYDPAAAGIGRSAWKSVIRRVDRLWIPDQAPHHSVVGQTGSGKTYLITRGILPLVRDDNVLIVDNKGGDPTLAGFGKPVRSIPRTRKLSDERRPRENWYHLIVHDDADRAREQVHNALEYIWSEGGWTVVADEIRALTDTNKPNLNMRSYMERIWLRGRSNGVSLIAGTQGPTWVPNAFYQQCSFFWVSRVKDHRAHQRIMEIGSMTREHIPTIAGIRKRQWLYGDDEEDETFMALTQVGV